MKRLTALSLLSALLLAACGDESGPTVPPGPDPAPEVEIPLSAKNEQDSLVPTWAKVAPEQIAEAKKHGVPVAFENDLGMRFVLIPAGTFLMGSPKYEEGREGDESQHEVTISRPFYMSISEVTNREYRLWKPDHSGNQPFHGDRQPAYDVSWEAAIGFAVWLSGREKRTYRLPTEAEWERACRAGTMTPFSFGESITTEEANYDGDHAYGRGSTGVYRRRTTEVGALGRSAWGLYDMHGNIWEWCSDWYGPYPTRGMRPDPPGPSSGTERVLRGGSWFVNAHELRSASRDMCSPDVFDVLFGFRLVSQLPEPGEGAR